MKTLYLCGPIQGRTDAECTDWREDVKCLWPHDTLDPMRRDYRGRERDPGMPSKIVGDDLDDINQCDALLVYFDKPSVGTSMEIFYASYCLHKPVVVVDKSDKPLSPWLIYHSSIVFNNIGDALNHLDGWLT